MEESFRAWWKSWFDIVWESLVPFNKWKTKHRNVQVGDVVLVRYDNTFKDPVYRRGRVTATHPDQHGLVRDAMVSTQPKVNKEKLTAKVRRPVEQLLPIQRLVVLLPVEEIESLAPPNESLHLCEEALRVPDFLESSPDASPVWNWMHMQLAKITTGNSGNCSPLWVSLW